MDDRDLDSAALWAAVDSAAAAQASRRDHDRTHLRNLEDDEHRDRGGEVVQPARPFKARRRRHPTSHTYRLLRRPRPLPRHLRRQLQKVPGGSPLDKSDYTSISGNPYIKKSGWRKISCFFNISFEIKDRSIEFDENRNVNRAEFLVRASMQGGRFSDGWGSCDRREKKFNKPNHDVPSTAETRAKNKACQKYDAGQKS
uniref:Uncharacterized protein n=1 Tax=Oryza nivara TaxID=4536 RepID=A0A0E0I646_ORYNI